MWCSESYFQFSSCLLLTTEHYMLCLFGKVSLFFFYKSKRIIRVTTTERKIFLLLTHDPHIRTWLLDLVLVIPEYNKESLLYYL